MGEFALGQAVSRFEDPRLLRGGGRYVDDMVLPRMAFGHVLRSPHAHARIRSIDTTAAKAAPGVLAVLTGADWEGSGWGDLPTPGGNRLRDGSPAFRPRFPALVKDRVRWVGDYVAFVVALTKDQAADAAELIAVDYEPLPAIVSTAEAVEPGAPLVWEECLGNVAFFYPEGDAAATDAAFADAAHVVQRRFVINRVTAAAMEPRGAIGDYNPAEDRWTIYTTLQRTHGYRAELARQVLKVPESRVRVVAGDIGGSFGMKSAIYNEVALVLLASKVTGRPVKWTSTRSEAFLGDAQARDNVTEAELALDSDGKFLGLRVKTIAAVGAYPQAGSNAFVANLGTLAGVYCTPAVRAEVTAVYTNTNPVRAYRGNGRPEAAYVIERMVDEAAAELGIDPIELRRRNTIPPEAMPFKSGLTFTYDCGEFAKNLDMALKACRRRRLQAAPRRIAWARKTAWLRRLEHDRARRGRRLRGGRDPLRPQRHGDPGVGLDHPGPGPRDGLQAIAVRPARHPSRSGALRPGRYRQGRDRRRHRRLALGGARRVGGLSRNRENRDQGNSDRLHGSSGLIRERSISPTASLPRRAPTGR